MVLASIRYSRFLLGHVANSAGQAVEYNDDVEALLRAEQGAAGFTNALNTDSVIYTVNASTPFTRNVRVFGSTDVRIRWFDLSASVRSFSIDTADSAVDITPISADGQVQIAGRTNWAATLSTVADDDILENILPGEGLYSGILHIVRSSGHLLTAAVGFGGMALTHEDTGLETVEISLYNQSIFRPVWR